VVVLSVVGTPIGNLDDISPRAARSLRAADVVACEDTRRTAVLLRHVGAQVPMLALHAHNEAARSEELLGRLREGARVALVSDAGMPGVSDPGARLVRAAAAEGLAVEVVPGPSAVTAAMALAGLGEGAGFLFVGFLPRRAAERAALIDRLADLKVPVVAFESPKRVRAFLELLARALPERAVVVCRELTKLHEQTLRGSAREVAAALGETVRGELTLVIGPAASAREDRAGDDALRAGLAVMIDAGMGAGRAAEAVAALGAAPRNRAYELALALAARRRESM
jgi:16S rRNA (cytidine1402-2'-O)-methyltransferase